jgi:hypothetical protein
MSNDKAAATYGQVAAPHEFYWNSDVPGSGTCTCGRPLSDPLHRIDRFGIGDQVLVTEMPAYDHHLGTIDAFSRGAVRPYFVRFDNGERYGWFDVAQLAAPTNGEQTWAKVAEDDPYAVAMPWTSQFKVGDQLTAAQRARWVSEDPDGYFAWVRLEAAEAAQAHTGHRDWTPTKGELGLAMGIVVFILVIFGFIVTAY